MLDVVKLHGGPVTEESLEKIDVLTGKQLLAEIAYLRATIAPDIRQKRMSSDTSKSQLIST